MRRTAGVEVKLSLSRRSSPPGSYLRQPGHCVLNAGKALGSGAGSAFQKLFSLLWMLVAAPGQFGLSSLVTFLSTCRFDDVFPWLRPSSVPSFLSGKVGREVVWFLASGWYQFVSFMSVLNVFFLTR